MIHRTCLALSLLLALGACTTAAPKPQPTPVAQPAAAQPDAPSTEQQNEEGPQATKTEDIEAFNSADPKNKLQPIGSPFSPALTDSQKAQRAKVPAAQKNLKALHKAALTAIQGSDYDALEALIFDKKKDGEMFCPDDAELRRRAKRDNPTEAKRNEHYQRKALATCAAYNLGQATLLSHATDTAVGSNLLCPGGYEEQNSRLQYITPDGEYVGVTIRALHFRTLGKSFLGSFPSCSAR